MASLVAELIVLSGPHKGHRVPISKPETQLGRDAACDVMLDDEASSRFHAKIINQNGVLQVMDLHSTNGTYLNDARISGTRPLINGDRLGIGDTVFLVQMQHAERRMPQVVFSDGRKDVTTHFTITAKDTRFLELKDNVTLSDAQGYLAKIHEFIVSVSGVLHLDVLVERMLRFCVTSFKADRGVLLLLNAEGKTGRKETFQREGLAEKEIAISKTMVHQVLEKQDGFLSMDAESDARLIDADSIHRMQVRSIMCVPLKLKDRVLGMIYVDRISGGPFAELDLKCLAAIGYQSAVCLDNSSLYTELLDAAEFNNSLLRSMTGGLMVIDRQGKIIRINKAALAIFGKTETQINYQKLTELPELTELVGVVQATLDSGKPEDRYEVRIKVDNRFIPLGLSTAPLTDHTGYTIGVVANFRSLTHIRQLEEQVRRSQHLAALGQMAAGVAHEIRNPLNSIRGFTQLIQEALSRQQTPDPQTQEFTTIILDEVDRMNRIVTDLLDFSRQRDLTLVPVDPHKLLVDLATEMAPEFAQAGIKLVVEEPEKPLPNILGNRDKLWQVFRNIVQNGLQACSAEGKVKVSFLCGTGTVLQKGEDGRTEQVNRREISISIEDTGPGIPVEIQQKIFDPFFTLKDIGTGLGLSISQKIVDQHGGRIDVKSDMGVGARFTVSLPVV